MSAISLRLPESLHQRLRELAEREGISINQFIATAVAEKAAALLASERIAERARRASRARFEEALAQVPDAEPDAADVPPALPSRRGVRERAPESSYRDVANRLALFYDRHPEGRISTSIHEAGGRLSVRAALYPDRTAVHPAATGLASGTLGAGADRVPDLADLETEAIAVALRALGLEATSAPPPAGRRRA